MDCKVDLNDPNISTTMGQVKAPEIEQPDGKVQESKESKGWNIEKIYCADFTVQDLIDTLHVVSVFKQKYPNDDTIRCFEDIVREEICNMFGGTTLNENYVD